MARSKVNGKKGSKFENSCYLNNCHHGDKHLKKTKYWSKRLQKLAYLLFKQKGVDEKFKIGFIIIIINRQQ